MLVDHPSSDRGSSRRAASNLDPAPLGSCWSIQVHLTSSLYGKTDGSPGFPERKYKIKFKVDIILEFMRVVPADYSIFGTKYCIIELGF